MHGDGSAFANRIQAVNDFLFAVFPGNHFAMIVRRNAAHLIMNGRHHGNRFLDRIHVAELDGNLANGRQAFVNDICAKVVQFEHHIAAIRTTTAAFLDFLIH